MTAYTYLRISDIESLQASTRLRNIIDDELKAVNGYAMQADFGLTESFIDRREKWGTDFADRPEAGRLFRHLKEGDCVLTYSILRMFSSCDDMQDTLRHFRKIGVGLYIHELGGLVTDSNFQPPFARVMEAFTQLEKKRSTERIKTVKESQRKQGRFLGGSRPFGYMIHSNGRLIENPMEQKVLKKIIAMKQQGKSLRKISDEVSTPMTPISFKTVQRILKRYEANQQDPDSRRI